MYKLFFPFVKHLHPTEVANCISLSLNYLYPSTVGLTLLKLLNDRLKLAALFTLHRWEGIADVHVDYIRD